MTQRTNLFVRDDKKRAYFLVVAHGEKKVELKALQQKIGSRRLSFASEADLEAILGLLKGSVTPFGALHDETHRTTVLLDEAFRGGLIGVHPNENTATVWLQTEDLAALLRQHGTAVDFVAV